jgi:hypothetical protein
VGTLLGDVIPAELLKQWVVEEVGQWRERLYGPLTTLVLFIEQVLSADHGCQEAVARGICVRVAKGQAAGSANTGPYCKARVRLPVELPKRLGREVGQRLLMEQPAAWRWRGREVKWVDGTTVSMPDTEANQARFPQNREQRAGLGFPLARRVAIVSLSCGAVLGWAVGPCEGKETGETALLWELAKQLQRGDVVVAECCYAGYFMLAWLVQLGVDVMIRPHQCRTTDFRRGQRLGTRDPIVKWLRPKRPAWMDEATYAAMPKTLTLREARVGGWTLVTTLVDPQEVHKQELFALYRQRWQVELDLRSIKVVMPMDSLRCKSPEMVHKELAVHLLAYNLVRAVMAQAAYRGNILPRQLSFKGALDLLNAFTETLRHAPRGQLASCQAHLLASMVRLKLPDRPGRVEPRAIKRRPKPHRWLTQPRHIVRARLAKQQEKRHAQFLR